MLYVLLMKILNIFPWYYGALQLLHIWFMYTPWKNIEDKQVFKLFATFSWIWYAP